VARAAAAALGIEDGPTYTQVLVGPGGARVGELAARLGGGHDAELCQAALGVDLNGLALAAARACASSWSPPDSCGRSRGSRRPEPRRACAGSGSTAMPARCSSRFGAAPTGPGQCSPSATRATTRSTAPRARSGSSASSRPTPKRREGLAEQSPCRPNALEAELPSPRSRQFAPVSTRVGGPTSRRKAAAFPWHHDLRHARATSAVPPTTPSVIGERAWTRAGLGWREAGVAAAAFLVVGFAILGAHVANGGFMLDDWTWASDHERLGGFFHTAWTYLRSSTSYGGSRPGEAIYFALTFGILGNHVGLQLAFALVLAAFMSTAVYCVLRGLGLELVHAGAIALLVLLFP